MLVGILSVFFLLVFSGWGGCVGNHTLFCLMLSFFAMLVWLGVYMGEHTLFFFVFLLLLWVGVYVREQALLPSICLFAFFSNF